MAEPLSRDITLGNGLGMRYYEWPGDGPVLVCLHPSSGYGRMWDAMAGALGGRLHVFALDQRGHGDTGRPDGSYTAEEYAVDLHLFLEQLRLGKAIVAGHSLGGRVAQVFAATYPDQAAAIVLVGGPHYSNFFQERDRVAAVLDGAQAMRASRTEFPSAEAAAEYLRSFRAADSEESRSHRLRHNTRPLPGGGVAFKYDNIRVAQGLTHLAEDLSPYAAKVTCPVAIVRGAESTHLTREEAERVAPLWRDSRIIEVDGDYGLQMEDPGGLARAILEFVGAASLT